ncbi:hypothetical protein HYH02_013171 [Chlamydomonas schloesseri]|uniref:Uncharacterized protein n=1 Tax=Chlamydomonas schloesseri TaxID=2026947 RepID=A0A835VZT5_9CHLO|nr:hypothetical protein HYH02_013171 [Chlamydomonas schloesseri]|eukprot:KAG2431953.1 hypothetical protein HYH02_013171 [Chlamydomonas schloesseri]
MVRLVGEHQPVADADDVLSAARKLHGSSMAFHYNQQTYPARHPLQRQSSVRAQFGTSDDVGPAQATPVQDSHDSEERDACMETSLMPKTIVLKPRPAFGSIIARQQQEPPQTLALPESNSSISISSAPATAMAACRRGRAATPEEVLVSLNARLQAEAEAAVEASKRWTVAPYPTRFVFQDEAAAKEAKAVQAAALEKLQECVGDARVAAEAAAADAEVEALAESLWGQERRRHVALAPVLSSLSIVRRSGRSLGGECTARSRPQSRGSTVPGEAPPEGVKELTLSDFPARAFSGSPESPPSDAASGPAAVAGSGHPVEWVQDSSSGSSRWRQPPSEASASAPLARPAAGDCVTAAAAAANGAAAATAAISDQLVFAGQASSDTAAATATAVTASGSAGMPVVAAGGSGRARRLSAPPQLQLSIPSWVRGGAVADASSPSLIAAATSPKLQRPRSPLGDAGGGGSTRSSHRSSAVGSERSGGAGSPIPPVFHSNAVVPQPAGPASVSAATTRQASAASSAASSGGGTSPVPALRRAAWQKSPSPKRRLACAMQVTLGVPAVDPATSLQPPTEGGGGKVAGKARFKDQLFSLFGLTPRSAARAAAAATSCGTTSDAVTAAGPQAGTELSREHSDDDEDEMMAAVARSGSSFCVGSNARDKHGGAGPAAGNAMQMAALLRSGSSFTAATPTQQRRLAGASAATATARRCLSTSRSIGRSSLARESQQAQPQQQAPQSPTGEGNPGSGIFAGAGRRVQQQALRQSVLKRSAAAAAAAAAAVAVASPPESPTAPRSPSARSPTQQSRPSSPKEGESRGEDNLDEACEPSAMVSAGAASSAQRNIQPLSPKSPFASLFAAGGPTAGAAATDSNFDGTHTGLHSAPCALSPPSPQSCHVHHSPPCASSLPPPVLRPGSNGGGGPQRVRQPSQPDPSAVAVTRDRRPGTPPYAGRPQPQSHHQLPARHRSSGAQLHGWSHNSATASVGTTVAAAAPAAPRSFGGPMPPLSPAAAAAASASAALIPQHHARRRSTDSCSVQPATMASSAPSEAAALAMLARVARVTGAHAAEQVWEVRPRDVCEHVEEEARLLRVRARTPQTAAQHGGEHWMHVEQQPSLHQMGSVAAGGFGVSMGSGGAFGQGYSHGMLPRAVTPIAAVPLAGLHSPAAVGDRAAAGSLLNPSAGHSGEGSSLSGCPSPFALSTVHAMAAASSTVPVQLPPHQASSGSSAGGLCANRPTPSFPRRSLALDNNTFATVFGDDVAGGGGTYVGSASHTLAAAAPSGGLVSAICSTAVGASDCAGAIASGLIPGLMVDPGCPELELEAAEEGGYSSLHLGAAAACCMSADNAGGRASSTLGRGMQQGPGGAVGGGEFSMRRRSSTSGYPGCPASADAAAGRGMWGPAAADGGNRGNSLISNHGSPASTGREPWSPGMRHTTSNPAAAGRAPVSGRADAFGSSGAASPVQLPPAASSAHHGAAGSSVLSGHMMSPPSPPAKAGGQQARLLHQLQPNQQQRQPQQPQLQFPGRRGSVSTASPSAGAPARSGASTVLSLSAAAAASPPRAASAAAGRPPAPALLPLSCPAEVHGMAAALAFTNLPDCQAKPRGLLPTNYHHHRAAAHANPDDTRARASRQLASPPTLSAASSAGPAIAGLRPSSRASRDAGYGISGGAAAVAGAPATASSAGSRRASTGSLPPRHHTGNPLYVRQAAGNLSIRMNGGAALSTAAVVAAAAACDDDDDNDSSLDIGYGAMALIPERVGSSSGEASPPASSPLAAATAAVAVGTLHGAKAGKEVAAQPALVAQQPGTAAARHHSDSHGFAGGAGATSSGGGTKPGSGEHGRCEGHGFVGRLKKKALSFLRRNAD